jgi:transcription antitermination factor NusG
VFPCRRRLEQSTVATSLHMAYNLWDRLGIEEDEEPNWYLLNCVATTELDLLRQCQTVCNGMKDVVKFVVPIEQKTRSHGANKMVTETKVKYPGYVFAKLRLSSKPYEAIQNLDLCRSWMGTVNRQGYRKLPPLPLALSEEEVENFGLEDVPVEQDDVDPVDAEGVIVDSFDDDDDEYSYEDPMYKNIDKKALKQFKGLKVEDMIKVTAQGKFFNEDGIVRRLKDGKIFVRFYTYGTMFEEWLDPADVRKLSSDEIIKGLAGPSQPITQRDFDGPSESMASGVSNPIGVTVKSAFGYEQRNRRQDREVQRFRNTDSQSRDADKNWNWYKEQQQQTQSQRGGAPTSYTDNEWRMQPGSQRGNDKSGNKVWAETDADSQWGRKPQRQERREVRKTTNQLANRQTAAAIDGSDDWSAFVSSSAKVDSGTKGSSNAIAGSGAPSSADDFFASLMTDLSKDLGAPSERQHPSRQSNNANPSSKTGSSEDDFFASLMTELSQELPMDNDSSPRIPVRQLPQIPVREGNPMASGQDDDFFAFLEADLEKALGSSNTDRSALSDLDDMLAGLKSESPMSTRSSGGPSPLNEVDDMLAGLTSDSPEPISSIPAKAAASKQNSKAHVEKAAGPAASAAELSKKTVPILKEMLRERGLKVGGNKSELVERLLQS